MYNISKFQIVKQNSEWVSSTLLTTLSTTTLLQTGDITYLKITYYSYAYTFMWDKRIRREFFPSICPIFKRHSVVRTHFCLSLHSVKFPWPKQGSRMILIQKNYHQGIFQPTFRGFSTSIFQKNLENCQTSMSIISKIIGQIKKINYTMDPQMS